MAELGLQREQIQSEIETINKLAADVQRDSEQLIEVARRCVQNGIQTEWGLQMMQQLEKFKGTQMADAINEIKLQAAKLSAASEQATAYSQGQI